MIAGATILYQMLLTRLFSVILWYHFSYMAISLAVMGVCSSGIFVHLCHNHFRAQLFRRQFCRYSFVAAIVLPLATGALMLANFANWLYPVTFSSLLVIFLVSGVPLFFCGIPIALAIYHRAREAGRIYAADLLGAGLGALLLVPLASCFPTPVAMVLVALILAAAPVVGGHWHDRRRNQLYFTVALVVIVALLVADRHCRLLSVRYARGIHQNNIFEKWNAYSWVTVQHIPRPFRGWAKQPQRSCSYPIPRQYQIQLDGFDRTPVVQFGGNLRQVEFLKTDITAVPYYLINARSMLNIGAGGGKDVQTALLFQIPEIIAVDLNEIVTVDIMQKLFREFTQVYRHPHVEVLVAEGRHYLRSSNRKFDIIQLAFADTIVRGALAGQALAENTLYTAQSFAEMIDNHLTANGMLTVTFHDIELLASSGKRTPILLAATGLIPLTMAALEKCAVANPRHHFLYITAPAQHLPVGEETCVFSMANLIVTKRRLSSQFVEKARKTAKILGYEVAIAPEYAAGEFWQKLARPGSWKNFVKTLPVDLTPATDDRPFYFFQDRWRNSLIPHWGKRVAGSGQPLAYTLLVGVLGMLVLLVLPVLIDRCHRRHLNAATCGLLAYFSCLGIGFMLVEITIINMAGYLLSHPIYSLAVTLTSILIFTALGSWLTSKMGTAKKHTLLVHMAVATGILLLVMMPQVYTILQGENLALRIAFVVVLVAPVGIALGMPMPMAIRTLATSPRRILIPWAWAVNGAASVLGSALAMLLAVMLGFATTLVIASALYCVAGIGLATFQKNSS